MHICIEAACVDNTNTIRIRMNPMTSKVYSDYCLFFIESVQKKIIINLLISEKYTHR